MPYVKQERRPALDEVVDELAKITLDNGDITKFLLDVMIQEIKHPFPKTKEAIRKAQEIDMKPNGDINYVLFKYCKYYVKPSYNNYKNFMAEIYRAMEYWPKKTLGYDHHNEFRESAEWIRIKILTPYEEKAIERNGDI